MTLGRRTKKQSKRKKQKPETEFVVVGKQLAVFSDDDSDQDNNDANPTSKQSSNVVDSTPMQSTGLSVRARKRQRMAANRVWKHFDRVEQFTQSNAAFCEYYQRQMARDLADPDQYKEFCEVLCTGLPVTLRMCAGRFPAFSAVHSTLLAAGDQLGTRGSHVCETTGATVPKVLNSLSSRLPRLILGDNSESIDDESEASSLLWHVAVDARELAKATRLEKLRDWIRRECALGHVTRQALTSMLPVAVLDLQPHHSVLDVCASPGSKTDHALDLVRGVNNSYVDNKSSIGGGGVVVANDKDPKRVQTLIGRLEGACKAEPGLIVTCAPAQELHRALLSQTETSFDRVICDVPCSGDGTIRKHPHLLRHWAPERALELHSIQLDIAIGAARALSVGGRMSYSTCSMNPIENEAVVLALVRMSGGALKVRAADPGVVKGLVVRPGLCRWEEEVVNDDSEGGLESTTHQSKGKGKKSKNEAATVKQTKETVNNDSERGSSGTKQESKANKRKKETGEVEQQTRRIRVEVSKGEAKALAKCMRILPHDQDTGGFFVAIIEKVKELSTTTGLAKTHQGAQHRALQQLGYNPKNSAAMDGSKYASSSLSQNNDDEVLTVMGVNAEDAVKIIRKKLSLSIDMPLLLEARWQVVRGNVADSASHAESEEEEEGEQSGWVVRAYTADASRVANAARRSGVLWHAGAIIASLVINRRQSNGSMWDVLLDPVGISCVLPFALESAQVFGVEVTDLNQLVEGATEACQTDEKVMSVAQGVEMGFVPELLLQKLNSLPTGSDVVCVLKRSQSPVGNAASSRSDVTETTVDQSRRPPKLSKAQRKKMRKLGIKPGNSVDQNNNNKGVELMEGVCADVFCPEAFMVFRTDTVAESGSVIVRSSLSGLKSLAGLLKLVNSGKGSVPTCAWVSSK